MNSSLDSALRDQHGQAECYYIYKSTERWLLPPTLSYSEWLDDKLNTFSIFGT